jgi:hypothetical protein
VVPDDVLVLSLSLSFFSDRNGGLASFQNPRLRTPSLPPLLSPHELSHFSPQLQMSFYTPPAQQRSLRACMVCAVVQLHNVRAELEPPAACELTQVDSRPIPRLRLTTQCLALEIHARRLSQLRNRPPAPWKQRCDPGMYLTSL